MVTVPSAVAILRPGTKPQAYKYERHTGMKKYKALVLGGTGMLGHAVVSRLQEFYGEDAVAYTCRTSRDKLSLPNATYFDAHQTSWPDYLSEAEYVINCIGMIKPRIKDDKPDTWIEAMGINSCFPVRLMTMCNSVGAKLIHITTDCVFSGRDGEYTEDSPHDCTDIYGKTKSLGEVCQDGAMVLRTSIIGTEPNNQSSLVEWVRKQDGKTIQGYLNHAWNGVTTTEFANVCIELMTNGYNTGLYHIHSPEVVTKWELVCLIAERLGVDVGVEPVNAPTFYDRSLSTLFPEDLESLHIPPLEHQIKAMPDFNPRSTS